jgi:hypothetical protein
MPRFAPGDRVMAGIRSTVFEVRSYNRQSGFYTVAGNISTDPSRPWVVVRVFSENELWPAALVEAMGRMRN